MKINIQPNKMHQLLGSALVQAAAMRHRLCLVVVILTSTVVSVPAALSPDERETLAQRFRPYIKTTAYPGWVDELSHPCTWQWFVESCNMQDLNGNTVVPNQELAVHPEHLTNALNAEVTVPAAATKGPAYQLALVSDNFRNGENWSSVIAHGDGIYAHVEEVNDTTVNIEYTILWPYNYGVETPIGWTGNHDGDVTSITVVYDRGCDLLTRVTYLMHGCVMEMFRIASPQSIAFEDLPGRDGAFNPTTTTAAKLSIAWPEEYQHALHCPYCDSGGCHRASDLYVYLAPDPVSLLFEHPVIYAESGSHEPWPNKTGSITFAAAHDGDGPSFLPVTIEVLGTLSVPNTNDIPFLHYNGLFGTDPKSIIFHKTWFWPEGRDNNMYGIPPWAFQDVWDPYISYYDSDSGAYLAWPPPPEHGPVTVYVDWRASSPFDGSAGAPFPDVMTAFSFVPKGGTVSVAAMNYHVATVLSRPCTVVATGGTVTLVASP